jgi:hypothetical protein
MPLLAVVKKGGAPGVRLVAGSESINSDGADLRAASAPLHFAVSM